MPSITVRDLTIRYDEVLAVNNLALHVDEGEFLVLLGASGSGKTSTLRAIAGLERPSDGEITFGDRCMFSAPLAVDVPPARRGLGDGISELRAVSPYDRDGERGVSTQDATRPP